MSRRVLVERVELRVCDGCGLSLDPAKMVPSRDRWYWLDLRVIGINGTPDVGRDACSPRCLSIVIGHASIEFVGQAELERVP